MLDKLQIVKQRFDEVSDLIIQPDIISDQKRYTKLSKEYKDLGDVVAKTKEYEGLLNNITEAKEIIAEKLSVDVSQITDDAHFINDLGADSIDYVDLVMALEEEYNIEIPEEDSQKMETVKDLIEYLNEKVK